MVTVTPDLVRDRVDLSSTDIEDAKVTDFIEDAEATIEEETGVIINYTDCSQDEAATIKNLGAIPFKEMMQIMAEKTIALQRGG